MLFMVDQLKNAYLVILLCSSTLRPSLARSGLRKVACGFYILPAFHQPPILHFSFILLYIPCSYLVVNVTYYYIYVVIHIPY